MNFGDLPEGKYYIADLIGLEVYEDNGKLLGIVDDVFNTKSNSVYVVKMENGELKYLPGIPDVIKNVDDSVHQTSLLCVDAYSHPIR